MIVNLVQCSAGGQGSEVTIGPLFKLCFLALLSSVQHKEVFPGKLLVAIHGMLMSFTLMKTLVSHFDEDELYSG